MRSYGICKPIVFRFFAERIDHAMYYSSPDSVCLRLPYTMVARPANFPYTVCSLDCLAVSALLGNYLSGEVFVANSRPAEVHIIQ